MWDAFLAGGIEAALSYLAKRRRVGRNQSARRTGWEGTPSSRGPRRALGGRLDEWTVDVEQIRAVQGEKELVFIRERGRSSSGLEMDERHAELYTVSDSKVVGRVGFSTRVTRSPKLPVEVAPQTRSNCEPLTRRRGLLA